MRQAKPMKKIKSQNGINRIAYMFEAGFEYFVSLLITGAFLASIMTYNGVSDEIIGITTSLSSFGFAAQALAVLFIRPKTKGKTMVVIMHTLNQLMFALLYMTPFVMVPQSVKTVLFVMLFLGGHLLSNVALPFKLSWMMSYVEDDKRGIFTARKEISSLLGGMVFSYAMGSVSDYFKAAGNPDTGFMICGITLFVLCVLHTVSMVIVRDDKDSAEQQSARNTYTFKSVLEITVLNSDFRKIIYLDALWHIATGILTPFLGTYQIKELGFTLTFVSIIGMVGSFARVMFSTFFGRYADKHSWAQMLSVTFFIGGLGNLIIAFTTPSNGKFFYVIYFILNGIYFAGTNSGIVNIAFDYVHHKDRAAALGIKSAAGGIAGFLSSLVGSKILNLVQTNGNQVFGITVYAQQILGFISFVVMMFVVIYIKKIIYKMKKTI